MNKRIRLTDRSEIEVGFTGVPGRPTIMLPIAKKSASPQEAEHLKQWGVDPELGKHFVEGLADTFQVLYFDYEGHRFQHPNPEHLTPEHVASDFLLIADEMNAEHFSYYGYSWLAMMGLQLAIRSDRLESLVMGGFPPYEGPYQEMLVVTDRTHELAMSYQSQAVKQPEQPGNPNETDWDNITVSIDPHLTQQFITMYRSLADFDDRLIHHKLQIPKLAFAGEQDTIVYAEKFGGVTVDIAGLLNKNKDQLADRGWEVQILAGKDMDHTKAMQPAVVLPLIKPWLMKHLLPGGKE